MKAIKYTILTIVTIGFIYWVGSIGWNKYTVVERSLLDSLSKVDTTVHYKVLTPEGFKLVKNTYIDSLINLKNKAIVVNKEVPVPVVDNSKLIYHDSLVTNHFNLHLFDTISSNGIILSRVWMYRSFPTLVVKDKETIRPFPVYVDRPKKSIQYYGVIGLGGFTAGGGVIFRESLMVGFETGQYTSFKIGYIFK